MKTTVFGMTGHAPDFGKILKRIGIGKERERESHITHVEIVKWLLRK